MEGTTKAVDTALRFTLSIDHIFYELRSKNLIGSRSDRVGYKIADEILSYSEKFTFNEAEIIKYVKGESIRSSKMNHIFAEFDKFVKDNNWSFSNSQLKGMYSLIHQVMMSSLSPIKCFNYVTKIFPLLSHLKLLLFQDREADLKQWEYIAEHCPIGRKRSKEEFIEEFENAHEYYKNISDDLAGIAIAAIVKNEIGKRFDNVISQETSGRGWFANGMFDTADQPSVQKETLYYLAFAFKLNLKQFDELCFRSRSEDSVFNPYDPKDAIFRFCLNYGRNYEEAEKLYEDNKYVFDIPLSDDISYDYLAMTEKIEHFFSNHTRNEDKQVLNKEFIDLLRENGVTNENDILLNRQRVKKVQEYIERLYDKVDIDIIKKFYSNLYIDNTDIPELLNEQYGQESEKYHSILEDTIYKITEIGDTSDGKNKILMYLCDGLNVNRYGLSSKAFTNARLNSLRTGNVASGSKNKIHRDEILRIAYLDTLISYYKGELNDTTILNEFEEKTNNMLSDCIFGRLHITLPLDSAIYIALSRPGRFKAQYFQIFIPRNV